MKRTFTRDELFELELPAAAIEDKITDQSRWATFHSIVFKHEGKYWSTSYRVGSTEMHDETPWKYDHDITCTEVRPIEKMIRVFEPVP